MIAGMGMGQGVLGRYAPIKQMQGGMAQAMGGGADTGAIPNQATTALREKMQSQPKPEGGLMGALRNSGAAQAVKAPMPDSPDGVMGAMRGVMQGRTTGAAGNPRVQSLMSKMRSMNPVLRGR
jgi:hypothetical protein